MPAASLRQPSSLAAGRRGRGWAPRRLSSVVAAAALVGVACRPAPLAWLQPAPLEPRESPPSSGNTAGRRAAVARTLALAAAGLGVEGPLPAQPAGAEVPRFVTDAFRAYGDGLQLAGDTLVFDVRPWIEKGDWDKLREMLRGDSMGTSKLYINLVVPTDRVTIGNEDFLEGTENLGVRMAAALKVANRTVWGEESSRRESLLKTWDDMANIVGAVMQASNKLMLEEKEDFKGIPSYVLPVADQSKYGRTFEQYDSRCKGTYSAGVCMPR